MEYFLRTIRFSKNGLNFILSINLLNINIVYLHRDKLLPVAEP